MGQWTVPAPSLPLAVPSSRSVLSSYAARSLLCCRPSLDASCFLSLSPFGWAGAGVLPSLGPERDGSRTALSHPWLMRWRRRLGRSGLPGRDNPPGGWAAVMKLNGGDKRALWKLRFLLTEGTACGARLHCSQSSQQPSEVGCAFAGAAVGKYPKLGASKTRRVSSHSSGARRPRSLSQQGCAPSEGAGEGSAPGLSRLLLLSRVPQRVHGRLLPVSSRRLPLRVSGSKFPLYKDTSHIGSRPTLMTSF